MADTRTKDKPSAETVDPTAAQLGTIATLCDKLGIEAPEPATQDEAQRAIEDLQALAEKRDVSPDPAGEPDTAAPGEAAEIEDGPAKLALAEGPSMEQTHRLFDKAVAAFEKALCATFEVEELERSQTPGIVGFLLPGYNEQRTNDKFIRCATCNGWGDVLTGSMKAGNEAAPCPGCAGRGYLEKVAQAPVTAADQYAMGVAAGVPPAFAPPQPNGQPEYGIPSYLGDPTIGSAPTP